MTIMLSSKLRFAWLPSFFTALAFASPTAITISQSSQTVAVFDFVEVTFKVAQPDAANPFTDVSIDGEFQRSGDKNATTVNGFADSDDGRVYRIRFMPSAPGSYTYTLRYRQGSFDRRFLGGFQAIDGHRHGPLRVDPKYPWHFIWEGTGAHYFFNGTTAYWLMGWRDERTIRYSINRLHHLKVNRMRVTLAGRTATFYGEPVMNSSSFTTLLTAWPAANAGDFTHPGFDYTRFNVSYWQRWDRMLAFARERDMVISVVLDMNDNAVHPAAYSEDERRFLRYAAARLSAFSNITWDLGDDMEGYRDDHWVHETGTLLVGSWDPYHHLGTSHPMKPVHQDRTAAWFGFTSFQDWSRRQHEFMLAQRRQQAALGHIIPQANEEYGYEDHYPLWAEGPGSDSADTLRRMAWEIVMAGGYQTTGETARRGTNIWPDTGGGWMNGRGDDTMTMLVTYSHMVTFMTSFEWWKTEPHDEIVTDGAYCLVEPGAVYAIYLPHGGTTTVTLIPGAYKAHWFAAQTGETIDITEPPQGARWTSPEAPDRNDWALLLTR
jgi:hypothetical protein